MKSLIFCFFLVFRVLLGAVDFDVVVVGTSPICLLEALYRYHTGSRVMILEAASECGGAWKSITACGIPNVDLGCHQLGSDLRMVKFLKETVGCQIVPMDHPSKPPISANLGGNGFYFVNGCYEMVRNLQRMIAQTEIVLKLNHPLESVYIDPHQPYAIIRTQGMTYTTEKILVTSCSEIKLENHPTLTVERQNTSKNQFYHLYLLIRDETDPRFSYVGGRGEGISRMMNLTHFVGLSNTGNQLVVLQLHGERYFGDADKHINHLIQQKLISENATLLQTQSHIYEQPCYNQSLVTQVPNGLNIFEMLQTSAIHSMSSQISRWESAIVPLKLEMAKGY